MTTSGSAPEAERVICEICLEEVPKSEASVSEARDYIAYFCSANCYRKWIGQRQGATEAGEPESEVQFGHGRSKVRDDRLKQIVKQHPQRDEPRVGSVEADDAPPP